MSLARSLPALAAILTACTPVLRSGDRHFAAGDYRRAAADYEVYLSQSRGTGPRTARASYRLALAYALPESPLHDTDRAMRLLEELLGQDRQGPYGAEVSLILGLLSDTRRLEEEAAAAEEKARSLIAELASLKREAKEVEGEAAVQEDRLDDLAQRIRRLERKVEQLRVELAEREEELRRLKAIDLGVPP